MSDIFAEFAGWDARCRARWDYHRPGSNRREPNSLFCAEHLIKRQAETEQVLVAMNTRRF